MVDSKLLGRYILDIVENSEIKEQKDLQNILKMAGYSVPQATLSRILKKLKIVKIDGVYKIIDLFQHNLPKVLNLQVSEYGIIVMHTHPGQANALAYFIDAKCTNSTRTEFYQGILGTIAGDDTVLVIVKSQSVLKDVLIAIHKDFPYLKI